MPNKMHGPLALVAEDPDGGFVVCDTRDGLDIAWRHDLPDAAGIAAKLNSRYPAGTPAPARDSLIHEVLCDRMDEEPEVDLSALDAEALAAMIPDSIGGPFDFGLWRPAPREEAP
jgi:hypothetical protein